MIEFKEHNETHIKVLVDDFGQEQELSDYFTFYAAGYKFAPKYRAGIWDGKIRLLNLKTKWLPKGLLEVAIKFCRDRNYEFKLDSSLNPYTNINRQEIENFISNLDIATRGKPIQYRDYQRDAICEGLSQYRRILIAATSSGKSSMLYAMIRWHIEAGRKILLVVPTTQLVEQMFSDFADYSSLNGWGTEDNCQVLYSGKDRVFSKNVMISTWQSLAAMVKNDSKHFTAIINQTDVAFFDEAHTYRGNVVLDVMSRFVNTKWRIGTTGTLDDSKINQLSLIGLMGKPYEVVTTRRLMDEKNVTQLDIKIFILDYPDHIKAALKNIKYKDEINYIVTLEARNKFIARLAKACKGNTLILFDFVEKHGSIIYELIKSIVPEDRYVKFIHGAVSVDEREQTRQDIDKLSDGIIIANSRLFSTGTNIPSIENIIFAMPSKSTIKIRQSIGRGLRLKDGKSKCQLFDIADDLSYKSKPNTTLNHLYDRIAIYDKEQFDYTVKKIKLDY